MRAWVAPTACLPSGTHASSAGADKATACIPLSCSVLPYCSKPTTLNFACLSLLLGAVQVCSTLHSSTRTA